MDSVPRGRMTEHLSIVDAVRRAGDSFAFKKGELAFLSLTSKVEHAFRDRVAFQLHLGTHGAPRSGRRMLSSDIVAREYSIPGVKRGAADVAVLTGSRVRLILEVKAMSGGTSGTVQLRELQKDLNRYAVSRIDCSIYCLLIAARPLERPPDTLRPNVIKYLKESQRKFKTYGDAPKIESHIRQTLAKSLLSSRLELATDRIAGGIAFGVPVELLWWLYGPFRPPSQLTILR